jgi:hypothetical protein
LLWLYDFLGELAAWPIASFSPQVFQPIDGDCSITHCFATQGASVAA